MSRVVSQTEQIIAPLPLFHGCIFLYLMHFSTDTIQNSLVNFKLNYMLATLVSHWMGDQKFIISSSSVLQKAR
jgi:hypothetical protein